MVKRVLVNPPALPQARESALAAARAEAAAASNALKTVETGIAYYAARKEYMKLKDIAEASDVAGKARLSSLIPPIALLHGMLRPAPLCHIAAWCIAAGFLASHGSWPGAQEMWVKALGNSVAPVYRLSRGQAAAVAVRPGASSCACTREGQEGCAQAPGWIKRACVIVRAAGAGVCQGGGEGVRGEHDRQPGGGAGRNAPGLRLLPARAQAHARRLQVQVSARAPLQAARKPHARQTRAQANASPPWRAIYSRWRASTARARETRKSPTPPALERASHMLAHKLSSYPETNVTSPGGTSCAATWRTGLQQRKRVRRRRRGHLQVPQVSAEGGAQQHLLLVCYKSCMGYLRGRHDMRVRQGAICRKIPAWKLAQCNQLEASQNPNNGR